jgi:ribose 5-phosphate isomerase A
MARDESLGALGKAAAGYVEDGMNVGLGTGRAAVAFVRALAERVKNGLRIVGVPTSEATRELARSLGIRLATLADVPELDLTIDGADEVDPNLDLVKGLGGALVREKIVAASSRRFVVVVGSEKLVERLGVKTPLPVEVVPFALPLAEKRLAALDSRPALRAKDGKTFVSDNGNHIVDCQFREIADPAALDVAIRAIPGVVGTGLFVGMAERVLVQHQESVRVLKRGEAR